MTKRKLLILIVLLVPVLGGAISFAVSTHHTAYTTVPNCYAVWTVAEMVIDYMDTHDGRWPKGWDDLRGPKVKRSSPAWNSFEDLQDRVLVDWNADPSQLARADPINDEPPFRVIWLQDGSHAHWDGREPNQMVLRYLQKRKAKEKKA